MRRTWIGSSLVVATTVAAAIAAPAPEAAAPPATDVSPRALRARVDRLPLAFEANRGQAPRGWDFLVRCRGYRAFVASTAVAFSFDGACLTMSLAGAQTRDAATKGLELSGKANYFVGDEPSKWITAVPLTLGARYADVLPDASWGFGGDGRALAFAFDLAPGAAPPRLRFDGGRAPRVADDGSLRIAMPTGEARISAPRAWQDAGACRMAVPTKWVVDGDASARVDVRARDPELPVRVDPTVTYESYLGGASSDTCDAAAVDAGGNAYLAGNTNSSAFPTTTGAFDRSLSSNGEAFVTKINAAGNALVYSTFVGSSTTDSFFTLAVDASGNAWAAGTTFGSDYPTTFGVFAPTSSGSGQRGVLTELNSTGSGLVFSTFATGTPQALALGPSGGVYVADIVGLSLYSAGGTSQIFSKLLQPTGTSGGTFVVSAVASDASGYAYISGETSYSAYQSTSGAYQTGIAGGVDAFVTKISASGSVVYSTFVGGSSTDYGFAIGVNLAGQAYVAGETNSTNYPVTSGAYRTTKAVSSQTDAFVTRFNAQGTGLRYSTYIGANAGRARTISVHPGASFVVGGDTYNTAYPSVSPFQVSFGGDQDGFLIKFNRDNTPAWGSPCGGSAAEEMHAIGMGPDGTIVGAGKSSSTDLPTLSAYQSSGGGNVDVLMIKIPDTLPTTILPVQITTTSLPTWTVSHAYAPVQLASTGGVGPHSWSLVGGAMPAGMSVDASGTVSGTPTATGTFTATVRADDPTDLFATQQISVRINPPPSIAAAALVGATVNTDYGWPVPVVDGSGTMSFSLLSGSPPPGLTLGTDGHFTGVPTQTGDFSFAIQVQDGLGATGSRTVSLHVADLPFVVSTAGPQGTEGAPYARTFTASAGTAPFTWTVASGAIPTTTPLDAAGRLSGPAGVAGPYAFTLRATDANGATADGAFGALINPKPRITTSTLPAAIVGRAYSVALQRTGGTPPFAWYVTSGKLPTGVALDRDTGIVSGAPTAGGASDIVIECDDAVGGVATAGFAATAATSVDLTKKKATESITFAANLPRSQRRWFELTQGTTLDVTASAKGGLAKDVELRLLDATGLEVDLERWTTRTSKAVRVKRAEIPSTGRYVLEVRETSVIDGRLTLAISIAPPAAWSSSGAVAPGAPREYRFAAPPGSVLSVSVKTVAPGAAAPRIVSVLDAAGADLVPQGKVVETSKSATFSLKVPLAGGDYRVTFAARDAGAGDIKWTVKLKIPKTYLFAMADVPAGDP